MLYRCFTTALDTLQGLLWYRYLFVFVFVCLCMCMFWGYIALVYIIFVFPTLFFHPYLKVSHDTRQQMRQSQRCSKDCSGVLVVVSLEETRGLLSRFDRVCSDCITQGCAGGTLAGCYEPMCQMLLFPYTRRH